VAVLTESRLVTVSEDALEVAHEALLREWPRLREWLEEDAEGRRLHGHLIRAAREWDEAGRDPAELYRGARLAAALDWAADHEAELNDLEHAFVAESQAASEAESRRIRRTNRRLRLLLAGAVVFLVAAVAGGILAVVQSIEAGRESDRAAAAARIALAREVAGFALANAQRDPEGSILAAVEAVEITRRVDGTVLPEAYEALNVTLDVASYNIDPYLDVDPQRGSGVLRMTSDSLLQLARTRVERPMTDEECRFYLHLEACPRVTVPAVVGNTGEAARSTLQAAGFRVVEPFIMATTDREKDGTVLVQDPARGVEVVEGSKVALVLGRYSGR
jgi:conflict system STAND superfamily ATPase/PASTA domain-containing protein